MRSILVIAALLAIVGGARAGEFPRHMVLGVESHAPPGWEDFCIRHFPVCQTRLHGAQTLLMDSSVMNDLRLVNVGTNRAIQYKTDLEHWGVTERWDYGLDGYGDCEDYVLRKRGILLARGYPPGALLVTLVRVPDHGYTADVHAVLTVVTDTGDFVLDSITDVIKIWWKTPYHFLKRQAQTDQNTWVSIKAPHLAAIH